MIYHPPNIVPGMAPAQRRELLKAASGNRARLREARHDTVRAIELYHLAHDAFGADQRVVESATRALTRLGAL